MQVDPSADQVMLSVLRRGARRTPWMPLLGALLGLAGGKAELLRHSERAWASVTFTGSRHDVTLAFVGDEAVASGEAFIAALPDHEFSIPRQLVADATVLSVEHTALPEPRLVVEVQLLLLEDA
jgi:hypothetical protein